MLPSRALALTPAQRIILLGGQLPPMQPNAPWIATGDSWFSGSIQYTSAVDVRVIRWGVLTALMEFGGNQLRMAVGGNKAVSGQTSAQISAQLTSALATLPAGTTDFVWFRDGFLNDVSTATTVASCIATVATDIARVRAAGGRCVVLACPPVDPSSPLSGADEIRRQQYNAGIAGFANAYVKVINMDGAGLVHANYVNQIHLNTNGFDVLAQFLVPLIASWLPTGAAKDTTTTTYSDNPNLTGGGATGPSNYNAIDVTNGGGCTASWSTSTKTITITGNYSGTGKYVQLQQLANSAPLPTAGDAVEALLYVDLPATTTNLLALLITTTIYTSGFANLATCYASLYSPGVAETQQSMARPAGTYVMRGAPVVVAAGTPFYRITTINIYLLDQAGSTAVNLPIVLNYANLRKGS